MLYDLALSNVLYDLALSNVLYDLALSNVLYDLALSNVLYDLALSNVLYDLALSNVLYDLALSNVLYDLALSGSMVTSVSIVIPGCIDGTGGILLGPDHWSWKLEDAMAFIGPLAPYTLKVVMSFALETLLGIK